MIRSRTPSLSRPMVPGSIPLSRSRVHLALLVCVFATPSYLASQGTRNPATLTQQLKSHDYRVYETGFRGFVALGKDAGPTLLEILRRHRNRERVPPVARRAAHVLRELNRQAVHLVPELRKELSLGSDAYFRLIASALGRIGPHVADQRSKIKRQIISLAEGNLYAEELVLACSRLEMDPQANSAQLRAALLGRDCAKKVMACKILARRGDKGAFASETLQALFESGRHSGLVSVDIKDNGNVRWFMSQELDDEHINCELAYALVCVNKNKQVPLEVFMQLLAHPRMHYRREAAIGLGRRGVSAIPAVLDLVRASNESRDPVAWEAITALGQIGPKATAAVPHLEYLARSENRSRAVRAQAALRLIQGR